METTGIDEVVRKQQQDWGEMRNGMLAEREIGKQNRKKNWVEVMKREEIEREGEKSEALKWANQREYRWVGTADQDPHLTSPQPIPTPP